MYDLGSLGKRLKGMREAAGLTQQRLAVKAGVSVSSLFQLEQGQKTDPRISTVAALAGALGVSVDDLLGPPAGPKKPARATPPAAEPQSVPKKGRGRKGAK
jgi:transcriptional regulator with XRE-family HTH domain